MDGVLTSVIAVAGTLAGATLTYLFSHLAARRAEQAARAERLRQDRIAAFTGYAGAMTDLRRALITHWFIRARAQGSPEARAAQQDADQRGAEVSRARFTLMLLTDDPELLRLADTAFEPMTGLENAAELAELKKHEARSETGLAAFVAAAGRQVR